MHVIDAASIHVNKPSWQCALVSLAKPITNHTASKNAASIGV